MAEHLPVEPTAADPATVHVAPAKRRRLVALALGAVTVSVTALAVPGMATAATELPSECRHWDETTIRCSYQTPGPGRFTVPAGVTSMTVSGFGAGGGTGGSFGRFGGGAGDMATEQTGTTIPVRPGDTYDFVVGTRGGDAVGALSGAGGDGDSPGRPGGTSRSSGGGGGGGGGGSSVTGPGIAWHIAGAGGGGGAGANEAGGMGHTSYLGRTFPAGYTADAAAGGAGGGGGGGLDYGEHGRPANSPASAGDGGDLGQDEGPFAVTYPNASNGVIAFAFTDPDLPPPATSAPPTTVTPAPTPGIACRGTSRTADLCVTVAGPTSLALARSGTLTTTVTNRGTQVARNVDTTVVVPGALRPAAGPLTFRIASLAPGQSRTYTVAVTAAQVMPNNVVQANVVSRTVEPVLRNNFATASTTVTR